MLSRMSRKLRVAVWGVGHLGKFHARIWSEHPRAELLKLGALHATYVTKQIAEAKSSKFVQLALGHYKQLLPLHQWLCANLK